MTSDDPLPRCYTALELLHNTELNTPVMTDFVMSCYDGSGGFGASQDNDPHILYTLSAVQVRLDNLCQ